MFHSFYLSPWKYGISLCMYAYAFGNWYRTNKVDFNLRWRVFTNRIRLPVLGKRYGPWIMSTKYLGIQNKWIKAENVHFVKEKPSNNKKCRENEWNIYKTVTNSEVTLLFLKKSCNIPQCFFYLYLARATLSTCNHEPLCFLIL